VTSFFQNRRASELSGFCVFLENDKTALRQSLGENTNLFISTCIEKHCTQGRLQKGGEGGNGKKTENSTIKPLSAMSVLCMKIQEEGHGAADAAHDCTAGL